MRLYPVVPMGTMRLAPRGGLRLGGHAIPGGAMLWVFFSAMFRSPALWDAPDAFRPARAPPTRPVSPQPLLVRADGRCAVVVTAFLCQQRVQH